MKKIISIILLSFLGLQTSVAGVVVSGTRVVFNEKEKEISVKVNNPVNKEAVLVQAWIDLAESSPTLQIPFVLTPPLARLEGGQGMVLRVIYTGEDLPKDRESLYYFNVLDMPPKVKKKNDQAVNRHFLQLAVQSRLKFFFRPEGLSGSASKASSEIVWHGVKQDNKVLLKASNNSPYHISFNTVFVVINGDKYTVSSPGLLPPFSEESYVVAGLSELPPEQAEVEYVTINDFGTNVRGVSRLSH